MTDTPVTRLRELHRRCSCWGENCGGVRPNVDANSHCAKCIVTYPCDTITALDALEDPRPRLPWRCTGCGAKADEVQWAAIDSIYYDGHTVGISEPDLCGPFRMPGDETEPLREENKQLQARLDAATELIRNMIAQDDRVHEVWDGLDEGPCPETAPFRAWLSQGGPR